MTPPTDSDRHGESDAPSASLDTMTFTAANAVGDPMSSIRVEFDGSTIGQLPPTVTPRRTVRRPSNAVIRDGSDYELIAKIGEGGMGVVYEGWQNAIDRLVALKLIKSTAANSSTESAASSESSHESFLAEAVLTAHLEHPNIIPIYDLGVDDLNRLFYVMKRVKGKSWREVIKQKSIDENLDILLDVADAVAFAHSRQIIHRDLKPHNVMLGAFGEVLLTDWGLAATLPDDADHADLGTIPAGGTPAYMAPEMARDLAGDDSPIGFKSDIYLLGAILYEIITGFPPHRASNSSDCLRSAAENQVAPPEPTDALAGIALKALATVPADRYASVQDFQQAIRDYRSHAESHRLRQRAREIARDAEQHWNYEKFGLAIATYQEALNVWAANDDARREAMQARVAYAECACRKGDLDLAESLLTAAQAHDSPIGAKLRELRAQRKQIAAEQRELQARVVKWTTAFLASPDCVLITRLADGTILEANDVFLRMMGCSRDDVVGKSAAQLNNWVDLGDREYFVRQLQQTGECNHLETRFLTFGGEILPMALSGRILTVDDETAVISHARDLSSHKRAEQELYLAQKRARSLRAVVDTIANAMLIIGEDGTILDCNASACSLFNLRREQILTRGAFELISRWDVSLQQWEQSCRAAASGEPQIVRCKMGPPKDESGNLAQFRLSALEYDNVSAILCVAS